MDSINSFIRLLDKLETQDRRLGMTIKNLRCLTGEKSMELAYAMALKLAEEAGLDLVKIAPTAKPPVCKIVDYGKYKYEQIRKEKEAKKKGRKKNKK